MQLREQNGISIYIQIAEAIKEQILQEILLEGEQAPSTNELAKNLSINPATAGKGLNLLVDEGILYKKRGVGMFVSKGAKEQIKTAKKEAFCNEHIYRIVMEAKNLKITKEELINMINKIEV